MIRKEAIEWLEDLKISIQNEIVGYEGGEREQKRIEALEVAIAVLKGKERARQSLKNKEER